jgi:hypothetical protein
MRAELLTHAGGNYGETCLIENSKMPAHMVAITQVRVHRIGNDMLCSALVRSEMELKSTTSRGPNSWTDSTVLNDNIMGTSLKELIWINEVKAVLQDIFLFKSHYEDQVNRVVRSLRQRTFAENEVVVKAGNPAEDFFLIEKRVLRVLKPDGSLIRTLGKWDYFGERGLLLKDKRSATCQVEKGEATWSV